MAFLQPQRIANTMRLFHARFSGPRRCSIFQSCRVATVPFNRSHPFPRRYRMAAICAFLPFIGTNLNGSKGSIWRLRQVVAEWQLLAQNRRSRCEDLNRSRGMRGEGWDCLKIVGFNPMRDRSLRDARQVDQPAFVSA